MTAETVNTLGDELRSRTQPLESDTFASALVTLRDGLSSSNAHTATAALEALLPFWPLLSTNASLLKAINTLIQLNIDKLGDANKRTRTLAGQALIQAATTCLNFTITEDSALTQLEALVKEGFSSKQARTRESCLFYIRDIRKVDSSLPLRQWLPFLLACLEDPDASVRESAREVTVQLYTDGQVPEAARADLRKELQKNNIRGAEELIARLVHQKEEVGLGVPEGRQQANRTMSATSVASVASVGATPLDAVQTVYIGSPKDMENEFAAMVEPFSGKETEHNWQARDKYINRIRGMLKSDAHTTYRETFLAGLKLVMENVLKIMMTLRTTLATATCNLIGELAEHLQTHLDPFYESILNALLKIAAQTKKLVVQASEVAMGALIANCSYSYKGLNLLWEGIQAKTVSTRIASAVHTKTMLLTHGSKAKPSIESSGGLALFVKILQKGIADSTPGVREASRAAYWIFSPQFPKEAQQLLDGLDPSARAQLQKSANGLGASTSRPAANSKPSVRAMIAAKKNEPKSEPLSTPKPASPPSRTPHSRMSSASTVKTANGSPSPRQSIFTRSRTNTSSETPNKTPSRSRAESSSAASSRKSPPTAASSIKKSPPVTNSKLRSPLQSRKAEPTTPIAKKATSHLGSGSLPSTSSEQELDASFDGQMVEAAMQDQAEQAEQAATRLLELAEEDPKTPMKSLASRFANVQLQGGELEDSPAVPEEKATKVDDELGSHSWWLASTEFKDQPEEIPLETAEDIRNLQEMLRLLSNGELPTLTIQRLRRLCMDHSVTTDSEDSQAFWKQDKLFNTLFQSTTEAVKQQTPIPETVATLALLKDMVIHQTPLLSGQEMVIFSLLFSLPMEHPFREAIAGMRTILALYLERMDPLYSLICLRGSLLEYITQHGSSNSTSASFAAAMKSTGNLFLRLPAEVLEEEVPQTRDLLLKGMSSSNTEVRHATVSAICAAHTMLKDDTRLFSMLDGLSNQQVALLTYFFARNEG